MEKAERAPGPRSIRRNTVRAARLYEAGVHAGNGAASGPREPSDTPERHVTPAGVSFPGFDLTGALRRRWARTSWSREWPMGPASAVTLSEPSRATRNARSL